MNNEPQTISELFRYMEVRFAKVDDLLETIAMATNAHAIKVDDLSRAKGDHESRIERLERSVARLNLKLAR